MRMGIAASSSFHNLVMMVYFMVATEVAYMNRPFTLLSVNALMDLVVMHANRLLRCVAPSRSGLFFSETEKDKELYAIMACHDDTLSDM
ncbi:hypothetical protein EJB05_17200 [Eragrostis curvula]|uniref:Uncharacterized protein n=1 Tax=Eragrostis curvula TaxID=38414 RepID=A0A5J9VHF4_9POAL|nr:hypothetical protein EJB05_17200 [Eragrostis curvula]